MPLLLLALNSFTLFSLLSVLYVLQFSLFLAACLAFVSIGRSLSGIGGIKTETRPLLSYGRPMLISAKDSPTWKDGGWVLTRLKQGGIEIARVAFVFVLGAALGWLWRDHQLNTNIYNYSREHSAWLSRYQQWERIYGVKLMQMEHKQ